MTVLTSTHWHDSTTASNSLGDTIITRPVRRITTRRKAEGTVHLTVTGSHRDPDAVMRRMVRATQILLAGYDRIEKRKSGVQA